MTAKAKKSTKKDERTATVKARVTPVTVPAGKLARGGVARNVPIKTAEYLKEQGEVDIIEIT